MISAKSALATGLASALIMVSAATYLHSQARRHQPGAATDTPDTGLPVTVEGLVRDAACPLQNHKSTATHFNLDCAVACARGGAPLVILTKTGAMYFPMKETMPDDGSQREKLLPYLGKYVRVSGVMYKRNGTRGLVVTSIREMPEVKLDTKLGSD